MTTDPAAAIDFYSRIFGWQIQPLEGSEMPYNLIMNHGVALAGISTIPQEALDNGAPPYWMGYISTPEIEKTVEEAVAAGATVLVPVSDVPKMGAFSVIQDPQGAVIALYREDVAPESRTDEAKPGNVSWHELATTDWKAAKVFYTDAFGWTDEGSTDMGPLGIYSMFKGGDHSTGGMYNKPDEFPGPPAWLYYFYVEDADATAEKVRTLGGTVINGPMEVPGEDIVAVCMDPQGGTFAVHASKKQ